MRPREDKSTPSKSVARGEQRRHFIERGLAARNEVRRRSEYFDADAVYAELHRMLTTGGDCH